eukprot:scaffold3998_cov153-Skeletonema_dohrnii-CCMP3373.AAC.15
MAWMHTGYFVLIVLLSAKNILVPRKGTRRDGRILRSKEGLPPFPSFILCWPKSQHSCAAHCNAWLALNLNKVIWSLERDQIKTTANRPYLTKAITMTMMNPPLSPGGNNTTTLPPTRRGRSKSRTKAAQQQQVQQAAASPSPARRFLTRNRSPSPLMKGNTSTASVSSKTPTRPTTNNNRQHRRNNSNGSDHNMTVASVFSYEDVSTVVDKTSKSRSTIRSMSPARMLSRLNNNSNSNKMTQSSPGRAAPSPIRAVSAGRSSSRTKSRDATTTNSTVHKTKQDITNNSVEEGLTVQGVEFVPLMITHTMSKPSPSRKQHHHHRSSVGAASPARSVTSSSYQDITTKGEVQHRVTSGSANDFFATNNPAIAASSPARTHQRIPSGGSIPTNSYNYNNDMSGSDRRSHKRVPSGGTIPTLYSNGSNRSHHSGSQSKSHHSRAPSAGSVPASYYSGGSANSPVMQMLNQDYSVGHGATTPQQQYQQQQQQQYQQQQRVYNAPPPPPPKFEFEATPPSLIPTSPNQLPEGFFSSNSVYGDSTTMGGSSIDESLNGDDHMNDLLGVLNEEERGRYWGNIDGGVGLMQQQQYHGNGGGRNDNNGGGEYGANENDDRYNDNPASRRGYVEDRQEEQVSSRNKQRQQEEREVRVSVVSPEKQRQQQRGKDSDEISTTIESPTSIFSVFNCGDITSDISETLSLLFSPTTVKKQQQQRELTKVPEDEEEEERLLMEKLQRLREKKWRGRSSSRPRARA